MSKYNVGDKFLVEIKEVLESDKGTLYRSDFSTLVFDDYGLDKLQKYNEANHDELNEAYNKGLNDAWELIDRINKLPPNDFREIFKTEFMRNVLKNFTPQEALAKLEAYKREQEEIKVGDVVKAYNQKGIVVGYMCSSMEYEVWMCDFERPQRIKEKYIEKTGKHIDIQGLLSQIGE